MRKNLSTILLVITQSLAGQGIISFDSCLESAVQNHPRGDDKEILEKITQNTILNFNSAWFPELSFNGQVTYQSDVIGFNFDSPLQGFDFPTAPKDQYKMYLDLRQTLYDAGRIKRTRELESIKLQSSLLQTETEIEVVKSKVIDLYYASLSLQDNIEILSISRDLMKKNLAVVESAVKNGTALISDADLIKVELLDIDQEIENLQQKRISVITMLSSITGMNLSGKVQFRITDFINTSPELNRKELKLLEQNQKVLELSSDLKQSARIPVAFAFGQFGYGNPGLNMLKDEFDTYYYVGLGLKWSIWDWNVTNRERANLGWRSELIDNQKKDFIGNVERAEINQRSTILTHQENIASYEEMLTLREGITRAYESLLKEGTIRTIDYLSVMNQERILRINLNNERILLQKAYAEYLHLTGNL